MATRIYGTSVGDKDNEVTEGVGSAVAADVIELTVEGAATAVNLQSVQRALTKEEVFLGVILSYLHILNSQWQPA